MESIKQIDYWAMGGSLLWVMIRLFMLYMMVYPEEEFPFTEYWSNTGVRASGIISLILSFLIFFLFIQFVVKKRLRAEMFTLLQVCIIFVCAGMWFDLWWSSTFYYGEVRDKQGLGFPWGSLVGLAYVMWRIKLPGRMDTSSRRWFFTIVIALSLWGLWEIVYEPWRLWQS